MRPIRHYDKDLLEETQISEQFLTTLRSRHLDKGPLEETLMPKCPHCPIAVVKILG